MMTAERLRLLAVLQAIYREKRRQEIFRLVALLQQDPAWAPALIVL